MPALTRALFRGLFDDAAVFPPGKAPLDLAVASHRRLRRGPWSDLIGPLLLPPQAIPAALDLAGLADLRDAENPPVHDGELDERDAPSTPALDVGIAARPGTAPAQVERAAHLAADDSRVDLRLVELGWQERWEHIQLPAPAVVVEVPRGTEQALAVTEIAVAAAEREHPAYLAKYRTGATETWAWPSERELARTIQAAVAMDVPLKLTGGLHHAVRCDTPDAGPMHGVLNVLATFAQARAGQPVSALATTLAEREPAALIAALAALSPQSVERLRADFPSYGCCTVTEPIGELVALGVLTDPAALEGDSL